MRSIPATSRTRVKRMSERGVYDRAVINAILDEALVCHVGFVDQDQPFVIPTIHVRIDDRLYLHGSAASRLLRCLAAGAPACITVTLLDGLVLARSAFHHSMNYRSVVVLGTADMVTDPDDKLEALRALTEHVVPSRWADARKPTSIELKGTTVLSLPINEASAKIRSGPPGDDEPDYDLPIWAGVIPLSLHAGAPESDPNLAAGIDTPEYAAHYRRS